MRQAFTLVELIIVFAIIAVLVGMGVGVSLQAQKRQAVQTAADELATAMKVARENALAGKKDVNKCGTLPLKGWEVVVSGNGYTLQGVCGDDTTTLTFFDDKPVTYRDASISNITTPTVLFKPLGLGTGNATSVTVSGGGGSQTVIVTAEGQIQETEIMAPGATPTPTPTPTPLPTCAQMKGVCMQKGGKCLGAVVGAADCASCCVTGGI